MSTAPSPGKSPAQVPPQPWEKIAAFAFGVIFVATMLVLAIVFPQPTSFQYEVFRIVLAIACGGVTAVVPGFLAVSMDARGLAIRAGGALAVFLLVYFFNPARLIISTSSLDVDAIVRVLEARYLSLRMREADYQELIKELTQAVTTLAQQRDQPDAPSGIDEALARLRQGNTEAAEAIFKALLTRNVANQQATEAARHLSTLTSLHDPKKALTAYRRAVEIDPANAKGWDQPVSSKAQTLDEPLPPMEGRENQSAIANSGAELSQERQASYDQPSHEQTLTRSMPDKITASISVSRGPMILRAKGEVRLKRGGSYSLTGAGDILKPGDILEPKQGADVIVFCDNVMVWTVSNGYSSGVSEGCPKGGKPTARGTFEYLPGGSDPSIPYTIHPRMTYLLKSRPTLHWNGVKGASMYTVRVLDQNNKVQWEATSKTTQVAYPKTAPSLKWGVAYMFSVTADTGASSLGDAGACMGFKLVSDYRRNEILADLLKITQLTNLTLDERELARAYFYGNEGLVGEAIEELETLVTNRSRNPLIYRQLARFYAEVGLNLLAEKRGLEALKSYRVAEDMYGISGTQAELAVIEIMLGKKDEAKQLADEAKLGYQRLGNSQGATQVDQWIHKAEEMLVSSVMKEESELGCAQKIETPSN